MSNRGRHRKFLAQISWIADVIPKDAINKMLQRQVDAGNPPNIKVFEKDPWASSCRGGFRFDNTLEGFKYWYSIAADIANYKDRHNLYDRS